MRSPARPFLELLRPPDGHAFAEGMWVTHDLNTRSLEQLVLPGLAGLEADDPIARRMAVASLGGTVLHVLAAADRIVTTSPMPMSIVDVAPVSGRRLHAKFVLLRFVRPPGRSLIRGIVTSGNLTTSGLTTNLEVWVEHTCDHPPGGSPCLARDLARAVRARSVARPHADR